MKRINEVSKGAQFVIWGESDAERETKTTDLQKLERERIII